MTQDNYQDITPTSTDIEQAHDLLTGYTISAAIYTAAKLNIADLLKDGPVSCKKLAAITKTSQRNLFRLLRALASVGVFQELEAKMFALTSLASTLRSDIPNSMRDLVIMSGSQWHWNTWSNLLHSVTDATPAFDHTFNTSFYAHMKSNPNVATEFHAAMSSLSSLHNITIAENYDFTKYNSVMDIGGGEGGLLITILNKYQHLNGILLDIPATTAKASENINKHNLTDRCEIIPGDFLIGIDRQSELFILKHVLHGMNDKLAAVLFNNLDKMMRQTDKLLIIEMVIPEGNTKSYSKFNDLEMMIMSGIGMERTRDDFEQMLKQTSLQISNILSLNTGICIIECTKAN